MALLGLFSFLGAFCSIGYQIVASLLVSDLLKNELIGFHLTVGVFLFGLALGALRHRFGSSTEEILKQFLKFEVVLALLGLVLVPFLYFSFSLTYILTDTLRQSMIFFCLLALSFVLLVGFFSGLEIPVLLSLGKKQRLGLLMGVNYFGGLLSSLAIPFFLGKAFNYYQIQFVFVVANSILALLVAFKLRQKFITYVSFCCVAVLLLLANFTLRNFNSIEQSFLKIYYMGIKVERISIESLTQVYRLLKNSKAIVHSRSVYQTIDILDQRNSVSNLMLQPFSLYLNRDPQFSEDSWLAYHESMIAGSMNLAKKTPREILIVGGGDGLLTRVLLERYADDIDRIDLVEVDPAIVELSNNYFPLRELSQGSLESDKVHLYYEDAFKHVRESKKNYDAIFIDLPYPNSFELTRLYSLEFYSALMKRLNKTGYAIMDAPIWKPLDGGEMRRPLPQDIIVSTLQSAGAQTIFAFGPIEPFIFFTNETTSVEFDYSELPSWLSNRSFMNLTSSPFLSGDIEIKEAYINSVFRPQRFKL